MTSGDKENIADACCRRQNAGVATHHSVTKFYTRVRNELAWMRAASSPLNAEDATTALRRDVPDLHEPSRANRSRSSMTSAQRGVMIEKAFHLEPRFALLAVPVRPDIFTTTR
jgi:hypothetical protein